MKYNPKRFGDLSINVFYWNRASGPKPVNFTTLPRSTLCGSEIFIPTLMGGSCLYPNPNASHSSHPVYCNYPYYACVYLSLISGMLFILSLALLRQIALPSTACTLRSVRSWCNTLFHATEVGRLRYNMSATRITKGTVTMLS
ncbi:hypothetical protein K474DRAFT_1531679 [Panus rudis PR-1116 ss-1]|nr:hypothetical protein K474DRAFT_1531679 [Panus rudis PR-1116 ss-1]